MKASIFLATTMLSLNLNAQNVGIGTTTPTEKLEVSGAVRIGSTASSNPGTIRYSGGQIEANEAGTWKSLVSSGSSYSFGGFTSTTRNSNVVTPYTVTVPDDGQYLIIVTSDMNNSQNYSGTAYDTHGYIYLKKGVATLVNHHALKNELEVHSTGYTISLVPAEYPKINTAYFQRNDIITVEAVLFTTGSPTPSSNWTINSLSIILVKLG